MNVVECHRKLSTCTYVQCLPGTLFTLPPPPLVPGNMVVDTCTVHVCAASVCVYADGVSATSRWCCHSEVYGDDQKLLLFHKSSGKNCELS